MRCGCRSSPTPSLGKLKGCTVHDISERPLTMPSPAFSDSGEWFYGVFWVDFLISLWVAPVRQPAAVSIFSGHAKLQTLND